MRWLGVAALAQVLACSTASSEKVATEIQLDEYHGFSSSGAWTYRDDGIIDAAPNKEDLLRARYTGGGVMDLRRGSRWADADPEAMVSFYLDERFSIVAWDLGPYVGEADLPLGNDLPKAGDEVSTNGWSCMTDRPEEVETYYGVFEDVLSFECKGAGGPEGDWFFAKDLGLIAYDGPDYSLSLVAPW